MTAGDVVTGLEYDWAAVVVWCDDVEDDTESFEDLFDSVNEVLLLGLTPYGVGGVAVVVVTGRYGSGVTCLGGAWYFGDGDGAG